MPKRWKIARLAHEITMGNRLSSPANAEYAMEYVYVSHAGRNALLAVSPPCRRKKNYMVHGAYEEPKKKAETHLSLSNTPPLFFLHAPPKCIL